MTPKEKANELFTTYHNIIQEYGDEFGQESLVSILAVKCSLVAVDEIIANIEPSVSMDVIEARVNYWNLVKNEIEKL